VVRLHELLAWREVLPFRVDAPVVVDVVLEATLRLVRVREAGVETCGLQDVALRFSFSFSHGERRG